MKNLESTQIWQKIDLKAKHVLEKYREAVYADFVATFPPNSSSKILDIGFSMHDLPSMNYLERMYPFPANVTATYVEEEIPETMKRYSDIQFVQTHRAEARLPFKDGQFDIVFSSAVIEHVGNRRAQVDFLTEISRVGRSFYITTPSRVFPLETHTFVPFAHYLPRRFYLKIYDALGFKAPDFANLRLLTKSEFAGLAIDAGIKNFKIESIPFLGMPGSIILKGSI
jgi:2-polyprenyl-3-methyl-5-hydroxy-6-metoxy-1,4-benzoquinol methylase